MAHVAGDEPVRFWKPYADYAWKQEAAPASAAPAFEEGWYTSYAPGAAWQRKATYAAYDLHGQLVREVDGRGFEATLAYDGYGRLASVAKGGLSKTFTYEGRGFVSSIRHENGHYSYYGYDGYGRLSEVRDAGYQEVARYAYTVGLPSVVSQTRFTGTSDGSAPEAYQAWTYFDGLGRLVQERATTAEGALGYVVRARQYDAQGRPWRQWKAYAYTGAQGYRSGTNRLDYVVDGVGETPEGWDAESVLPLEYDARGSITALETSRRYERYAYERRGLMVGVEGVEAGPLRYRYDASGLRYYVQRGTGEAEFMARDGELGGAVVGRFGAAWGALRVWNLLGPTGEVVGRIEADGAPGGEPGGARRYYYKDALGSVRAVVDAAGAVVESRDYSPWGLEMEGRVYVSGSKAEEGFTGHELDQETNLLYAGSRYYMSALGRWTTVDPLADEYPGVSPYAYVLNNPLVLIDPTGACPEDGSEGDAGDGDGYCLAAITVEAEREDNGGAFVHDGVFYFDTSTEEGQAELYSFLVSNPGMIDAMLGSDQFSMAAQAVAWKVNIHAGGAAVLDWGMNHPAMIAMTLPIGGLGRGGVSAFRMYRSALQAYKSTTLTNVGRALTKHPEVVGLTKQTLRQAMRLDSEINLAAQTTLKTIMRTGVQSVHTLPRYGSVVQYQIPGGFGARFYADTGQFIGFINP